MKRFVGLGFTLALALAPAAHASLVLQSLIPLSGTGLGTEPTILTIQNSGTETGCVSFSNLGATGFSAGTGACTGSSADVKTGASQTSTQLLSAIGSGGINASNLGIVFNADQPAGGGITLTSLNVAFYDGTTGALLFQSGPVSCTAAGLSGCAFTSTVNGIGGAGYLFQLDAAQQTAATTAGAFSSQSNIVGLSASASNASGGSETFFLARIAGTSAVPEPASFVLMGAGLIGLLFAGKRRSA
jgi:hypothetical protein